MHGAPDRTMDLTMPTSLFGLGALLIAVLFVTRFRRADLDEDSQAALAKEELRARRLIVQTLIVGTLGTIGLGTVATLGVVSFTAVRIAQMTHALPATPEPAPLPAGRLAELREARAGLLRSIATLEKRIADVLAQPTRPDGSEYERGVSTEGAVARGVEELRGNLEYERDRLADIDAELGTHTTGGTQ